MLSEKGSVSEQVQALAAEKEKILQEKQQVCAWN